MLSSAEGNSVSHQARETAMSHFSKNQGESKFETAIKKNDFAEIKKLLYLPLPEGFGDHSLAFIQVFWRDKTIAMEVLEDLLFRLLANDQAALVKHLIGNLPWVFVDQSQTSISNHGSLLIALLRKHFFDEVKNWFNVFYSMIGKISFTHSRNQLIEIIQILHENQQTEFLKVLLTQPAFIEIERECFVSSSPLQQLPPQVESKAVVTDKPKIDLAQLEKAFWNGSEQAGDQLLESLTPRTLKGLLKNSIVRRKPEAPPAYEEGSKHVATSSFSNGVG